MPGADPRKRRGTGGSGEPRESGGTLYLLFVYLFIFLFAYLFIYQPFYLILLVAKSTYGRTIKRSSLSSELFPEATEMINLVFIDALQ